MGRHFSQTVNVDVDIDNSVLEENGFHHEEDCPDNKIEETMKFILESRQNLEDWHDQKHGLGRWTACAYEPCNLLKDAFKTLNKKVD